MIKKILPPIIAALFLMVSFASAQQRNETGLDTLSAYREFVSLGKWYLNTPLSLKVHFRTSSTPSVREGDKMESDIQLYYGKHDFYMNAGDLEQIINDSLTVLVNNEAKMIKVFSNTNALEKSMEKIIPSFLPDSSLQKLASQYNVEIIGLENGLKKMVVSSKAIVSGTAFNREAITIVYHLDSYQPVSYVRTTRSLIPVDPTIYVQMQSDSTYQGRLVESKTKSGELFFVMKEKITDCRFDHVDHATGLPSALLQQRIDRSQTGEFVGAKGFEEYQVSINF
ncbi:MAG: hypothetical protein QM802_11585 [Agriterribacter sp.]